MKYLIVFVIYCFFITKNYSQVISSDWSEYVNPLIGTANDGNVFPGATLPFGMVKLGPDTKDRMSNAGFSLNKIDPITGFSHLHVSGTGGGPKYGNVLVMPFTGNYEGQQLASNWKNIAASPGFFSVELTDYSIKSELTVTHRVGFHRYTFPSSEKSGIIIDAGSYLGKYFCCGEAQQLVGSEISVMNGTIIQGHSKIKGGWNMGKTYTVYFYAVLDTRPDSWQIWRNDKPNELPAEASDNGDSIRVALFFKTKKDQQIKLKLGISFISVLKAKQNLNNEIPLWNFDEQVMKCRKEWNSQLSKIDIEAGEETKKIFYTALYHTLLMPSDRTGENPDWNSKEPYYDDYYAIWDTYRTVNPLLSIICPSIQRDLIRSAIDIFDHEGYLPDARSGNDNGRTQGGSDCDIMIADAYVKGVKGIDYEKALKGMIKNAEVSPGDNERKQGRGGIADYNSLGYVSIAYERSGNRTVEFAHCDYAISQVAKGLAKTKEFELYKKRSNNWQNLWRPVSDHGATGFIMPRRKDGTWVDTCWQWRWDKWRTVYMPFTVFDFGTWPDVFYEANSWVYSFYVPHDVQKLIDFCGGKEKFIARMDTLFKNNYYDVTNEPSFLIPCLYNYVGRPDKTAEIIRKTLKQHYNSTEKGLPGNDDSGAMSAWYIFHALGFYPNAGQDVYLFSSPVVTGAVIHLENGKKIQLKVKNQGEKNIYIQSVSFNGKQWDKNWFRHSDISSGGIIEISLGNKPSLWGRDILPPSMSNEM